jgi:transcription initiation factor TFIIB
MISLSTNNDTEITYEMISDLLYEHVESHAVKQNKNLMCETCKNNDFVDDSVSGIKVCRSCGQVIDTIIDSAPEWKNYEDDKGVTVGRCGLPSNKLLPQSSVGTNIAGSGKIKILHNWNAMPYRERSLNIVLKLIHEKCQREVLSKKIEDDAKIMYKLVSDSKHLIGKNKGKFVIMRGTNRESIIAASLFFACRRNNVTRSPKEIANLFELNETDLNKGAKNFIKLKKTDPLEIDMGTSKIEHFIKRKCDKLGIIAVHTEMAIKISKNLEKLNLISNHTPYSLAAASILLMTEINKLKNITKKKLAFIFNVSDVTIIKTYKKIEAYKNILLNDSIVNTIVKNTQKYNKYKTIPVNVLSRMNNFSVDITPPEMDGDNKNKIFTELLNKLKQITFVNKDNMYNIIMLYYNIETFLSINE